MWGGRHEKRKYEQAFKQMPKKEKEKMMMNEKMMRLAIHEKERKDVVFHL